MARRWARRVERYCCSCITYFPLAFVYGLTTWAVWVVVNIGSNKTKASWVGTKSSIGGILLYLLLNWCYTTAVFTDPGSTTNSHGYSTLPTTAAPNATSFTVKSNGELRFCKKCQARKPDRAHHCSTCKRCVLKMDHHCPWLATCIGLHNHKAFLLFLIYTTFFCFYSFAVSGSWVYSELVAETQYVQTFMPVNYIMLAVISGIIGIVVGAFCSWHILLASRGQTTIECLEKTRYLSPLRKQMHHAYNAQHNGDGLALPKYGQQLLDIHQNAIPGVTRPEEGEVRVSFEGGHDHFRPNPNMTFEEMERQRARKRYDEYLDEQDSDKLPSAFDLGAKRNLLHLFGHRALFWALPIMNTTGDGWSWEASPKWLEARDKIARDRDEQRQREQAAGWGSEPPTFVRHQDYGPEQHGVTRQYITSPTVSTGRKTPSKADRVLGRDPNLYADEPASSFPMRKLSPYGADIEDDFDTSSDEEEGSAEHRAMNVVTNGAWARSGASGLLRKPSTNSSMSPTGGGAQHDDEVD
ncbi:palmitoyltransferase for Vac8p [Pestalotiopsis sp. 9143b]|nr:palmitoyltransferase for Vac8p [Pestalotiopsis sp. 9143b]